MPTPYWLDAWRVAHARLNELRDLATELGAVQDAETIADAHRRVVSAFDHAMLEAFARGAVSGGAASDPTADRAQIAALGASR